MQHYGLAIALVAATTPIAQPHAVGQGPVCIADWSIAAPIVKEEGLFTIERLSPLVRLKLGADIVKATLCKQAGGYVFQLVIRSSEGRLRRLTLDARTPFGNP